MDDLLSPWEEFELEVRHTIGDDTKASKVIHLIKNRFAITTDIVKREYKVLLKERRIEVAESDFAVDAMRKMDNKFLSLGDD